MAAFPDTPLSLLAKIAAQATGVVDERRWMRFFALYEPALRKFAELQGAKDDAEDVVQEILLRLVDVLRNGRYSVTEGRFRAYLATLVRRELVSRWRKGQSRGAGRSVSVDATGVGELLVVDTDAGDELDAQWHLARRLAAREHVLTKTALAQQSKDIYTAYVVAERPIGDVAAAFGVSRNVVSQIKVRVDKMIAAIEAGMA